MVIVVSDFVLILKDLCYFTNFESFKLVVRREEGQVQGKIMWGRLKGDMVTTLLSKIRLLGFPS